MYKQWIYIKKSCFFVVEKTMKRYFEVIILSLKIYENILRFNFLMGGGGVGGGGGGVRIGDIDCFYRFLKRSFNDVKNDGNL